MNKTHPNIQESSDTLRRFTKPSHQIQETFNPAVIPKNKQNLQPTRLAKVAVILQPESLFLFCLYLKFKLIPANYFNFYFVF